MYFTENFAHLFDKFFEYFRLTLVIHVVFCYTFTVTVTAAAAAAATSAVATAAADANVKMTINGLGLQNRVNVRVLHRIQQFSAERNKLTCRSR